HQGALESFIVIGETRFGHIVEQERVTRIVALSHGQQPDGYVNAEVSVLLVQVIHHERLAAAYVAERSTVDEFGDADSERCVELLGHEALGFSSRHRGKRFDHLSTRVSRHGYSSSVPGMIFGSISRLNSSPPNQWIPTASGCSGIWMSDHRSSTAPHGRGNRSSIGISYSDSPKSEAIFRVSFPMNSLMPND